MLLGGGYKPTDNLKTVRTVPHSKVDPCGARAVWVHDPMQRGALAKQGPAAQEEPLPSLSSRLLRKARQWHLSW